MPESDMDRVEPPTKLLLASVLSFRTKKELSSLKAPTVFEKPRLLPAGSLVYREQCFCFALIVSQVSLSSHRG